MKIVMAPHSYLPVEAGVELNVYNHVTEYVKQGHEVIVLTGREPYFRRGGLPWHEKVKEVDVYRYHMDFPRFGRKYPWFGLRSSLQFLFDLPINIVRQARLLRNFDPNIINVFFLGPQAFWLLLTKHWARKAALVISPLGPNDVLDDQDPKPWLWKIIREKILLNSKKINCYNTTMKNAVLSLGVQKEKCESIPLGIDTDRFKPIDRIECRRKLNLPIDKKIILYISRLWKNKGVLNYLEACRQLVQQDNETLFYLLGEGELRSEIEYKIQNYELNDRFFMLGKKPNKEVALWINASDVMICVNLFDSFGHVHYESLACGTPIIESSNWKHPPGFEIGIHGLLVRAGDVDALSKAITKAINIDWNSKRISGDWSQNTWPLVSKKMISMYQQLLNE